jgi:glycosyltransferase involved in cell wall biosynthesis
MVSHETTLTGAPIQLLHLARFLHTERWKLAVAAPERGPIPELLDQAGVPVVIHPGLLEDRTKLRELAADFDVVLANTIVTWNAVRAARDANKPVIWYLHETLVAIRLIRQIPEIAPALHMATLLVTPTQQTARVFQGLTDTPVEVVPYGIPRPEARTIDKPKGTTFITLASIEPRKGQDILVDAIRQLPAGSADAAHFNFVGRFLEQPFADDLKRNAADLAHVEFSGESDHDQSLASLAAADVLVCPSRDETMPITILEAMGLGKAVISADVGGIAEWMRDEINGLLVPPENPRALAKAIARCLADPELIKRLGAAAGRTFARHFTMERFGKQFGELLKGIRQARPLRDPSIATGYTQWLRQFGGLDAVALRRELRRLPRHPRISIVLPVYNPGLQVLEEAIDSVCRQIYSNWELCIADDASTDPAVRPFLEKRARADGRIKLTFRDRNGHISACSNSALSLATGEWCALLDQDDALAEEALVFVAREILAHPDAGLIYSDEDKIDESGERSTPFFKPDWNPELFLGQNYINHLGVYRTELLREIGGFREGFEGSQDYDLALRCIDRLRPEQVRHIPRVLYHWRMVGGSLAAVPDAKPYAREAARRAIAGSLARRRSEGRVEACPENNESHRVVHPLPERLPLVSVIIPTRDRLELLRRCIASVRTTTSYDAIEITVVDNGSVEIETLAYLRQSQAKGTLKVLRDDEPFNYSRLNNRGATFATGEILLFLNNDTEVEEPGWLSEMVSHLLQPGVGAVGARLWFPNDTLQHGGVVLGLGGVAGHAFTNVPRGHPGYFNRAMLQQNCSAVTGACLAVRKNVFEELGGFDEANLGVTFNDIDFCLRLRQRGYRVVWTPYANLVHHESASRGHQRSPDEKAEFLRAAAYMHQTWGTTLLRDPFYNPNLSLSLPGFELAFPPRVGARQSTL